MRDVPLGISIPAAVPEGMPALTTRRTISTLRTLRLFEYLIYRHKETER
jgi:hypothetical protein